MTEQQDGWWKKEEEWSREREREKKKERKRMRELDRQIERRGKEKKGIPGNQSQLSS